MREDGTRISSDVGRALPCEAACRGVVLGQGRVGQEEGEEEEEEEEEDETQEKTAGGRYFFAPLYLAVTCLTLVLPEEYACRFSGRCLLQGFRVYSCWFNSGYMFTSVYRGLCRRQQWYGWFCW